MAGRLVLLSFEDYKEGEAFTRKVTSGDGPQATVEWVIARPTAPCKCARTQAVTKRRIRQTRRDRGSTDDGFTMRQDWGWWVHAKCLKPAKMVVDRFTTNLAGGSHDLLPKILGEPNRVPNDLRKFKIG